jgi:hypothetical protein
VFVPSSSLTQEGGDLGDRPRVGPEQRVRAPLDRDRPLGGATEREAAHAERGGLLLHATGVCQDECRVRFECQECEIAKRLARFEAAFREFAKVDARSRESCSRPRMEWKEKLELLREIQERVDRRKKEREVVDE